MSAPVSFNRAAALVRLGQPSLSYPKWKVQMAAVNSFGGCFNSFDGEEQLIAKIIIIKLSTASQF